MIGYMQTVVSPQTISREIGTTLTLTHPSTVVNSIIVGGTDHRKRTRRRTDGQFDPGSRPINPDNGDPLDDIDSGYIGYINNQNYNKVVIAPVSITGSNYCGCSLYEQQQATATGTARESDICAYTKGLTVVRE